MTSTGIISIVAALVIACASAAPASAWGERKNQAPFVRTVVTHPFVSGEPKNESPFTNPVDVAPAPAIIVADTRTGFRWADAGVGAAAGLGLALVAAGLAALALTGRRHAALQ